MSTYIYIVYGSHNDGECTREWDIIAFTEEKYATDYCDKTNAENRKLQEAKQEILDSMRPKWFERARALKNKYDNVMFGNECDEYSVKLVWIGLNVIAESQPAPEVQA